ncbi:MAG: carboxypeptidase regulatory-like domain-containing protein [Planctomycetales bacterium]|nr:carboxypeptidase regulatory-like domain-containing protein [Planctomycetales bacterium]
MKAPTPTWFASILCLTIACLSIGCAPGLPAGHVAVTGTVTRNGAPLGNATVVFTPEGETAGRGGGARTDAAGQYILVDQSGNPGVLPGVYRVTISKLVGADGEDFDSQQMGPMDANARESLPARYSDFTNTELRADVSGTVNEHHFALTVE